MTKLTVSGKTIEEAISKALSELGTTKERLRYEVIEQPQKGFLGIIGTKPAIIEAYIKPDAVEMGLSFLKEMIEEIGFSVEIEKKEQGDYILFEIIGQEDMGRLIGKRGQTLDSLEYLTNLVANKQDDSYIRIQLDTENYRAKRREALEQLAHRVSRKVLRQKQKVVLEPMNAGERKVIHTSLQNVSGVDTYSQGKGSNRHIVIVPETK
ncbi:protein jag [Alkalihalobacillus alcalophilus ATCC 27647 = CGMCC 1.3604]|uniref:RNA-binding protein KhpB n=1 Tax=Alkalihalobacillus alcalophilus ATCC 27647 = CGMCC 1.3604 TaxID=1218173 RepID=A0A094WHM9_ALKAL|nr:RNA-binding cell elongation regulator Jag/EloR [Alkalihalobacillus alcalophilus]KGA96306.1 DNA-binding protein [Alkalihalobacillus alcalophilus ATCC 27647 = CGMCC 1.3604]MED1560352.1 RNA-binding cell elongation regulator Jag/EloR [Alkalihalobacillus alcalophilus]THG89960.1 protein jag [Alkalihalobacillus alcalophilus ATCC 27647 = CGMCC 1.3604]